MAKIRFENGQVVNFEGQPTAQDVEEVAASLGIGGASSAGKKAFAPTAVDFTETVNAEPTKGAKIINTIGRFTGQERLGKTIGEALARPFAREQMDEVSTSIQEQNQRVRQRIDEMKARGEDTSRLEAALAANEGTLANLPTAEELTPEASKSGKQIVGEVLESASAFVPVGKAAQAGKAGVGLLRGGARTVATQVGKKLGGAAVAGGISGAMAGAGQSLAEDEGAGDVAKNALLGGGLGTLLGSRIPGAIAGKTARGLSGLTAGLLGKTTGTGDDIIREAVDIVTKGNKTQRRALIEAMRGDVSPQQIVDEADSAFRQLKEQRRQDFQRQFADLDIQKTVDIKPLLKEARDVMDEFKIGIREDGTVDFSRSSITNDAARKDIQNVIERFRNFGADDFDKTAEGVNNLRLALQDAFVPTRNSQVFVERLRKTARDILGKEVPGFNQLQDTFGKQTEFIEDVQKALSLGDKKSLETAFKKIVSTLRNNNELRQQVVRELDEMTGGVLLARSTGSQLSEGISRGLIGALGAPGVIAGVAAGAASPAFLVSLLALSPRLVGEVINSLGLPLRASRQLKSVINNMADAIGQETIGQLRRQVETGVTRSITNQTVQ